MNTVAKTPPNRDLSMIRECAVFNAGRIVKSGISVLNTKIKRT